MYYDREHPAELDAVRHLLRAPAFRGRAEPYAGPAEVDWAGLLVEVETMSGGESLLVRIAHDLWHRTADVAVWEIPTRFDSGNFERVVSAMRMCQGWTAL